MVKVRRKIIKIDDEKCDGCGLCIPSCPEGALQIVDGKARLIKENFCDGLGACLGECPQGALTVEEEEVEEYKVSCPSAQMLHWEKKKGETAEKPRANSELAQWPIQLHLVPPYAPYFQNADLILVADCVPFAYPNFHRDFLKGKAIAICCPKLDDITPYQGKITQILKNADVKSLKVVYMEVPCCYGLVQIAQQALAESGKDIPFESVKVAIKGEIL